MVHSNLFSIIMLVWIKTWFMHLNEYNYYKLFLKTRHLSLFFLCICSLHVPGPRGSRCRGILSTSYSISFILNIVFAFSVVSIFLSIQFEHTFIAIKPDGVQRGLVSYQHRLCSTWLCYPMWESGTVIVFVLKSTFT